MSLFSWRLAAAFAAVVCLSVLAGCSSTAAIVRLHSLLPAEPGTVSRSAASLPTDRPVRLSVAPVTVPAALDQPQWLVRRGDNSLQLLEQDRWASPLADELRGAVREGLAERWSVLDGTVPALPSSSAGQPPGQALPPAWRLVLDLQRLDTNPGRDTLLQARWTLLPPQRDQPAISCNFLVREPVLSLDTLALADAHRRAVQRLVDDIGTQLQRWGRGDRSRGCGGSATAS